MSTLLMPHISASGLPMPSDNLRVNPSHITQKNNFKHDQSTSKAKPGLGLLGPLVGRHVLLQLVLQVDCVSHACVFKHVGVRS